MDGAPVNDVKEGSAPAAQAQAEHSTPQTEPRAPESQPDLNIKFTPESQQGLHELEALLQGPAGLSQLQSQEPLMQTQDCSLQQEMLQAEHNSTERDQNRAQQAAAALRGEAAAGNSAAGVLAGADGGLEPDEAATMAALHAAAAAAAAAGGSAQDADELLKLAQAAQQLQQQQGIDPSSYAALQQQGLDWSGFAAGMPMAMGAQAGLMNSGYYWPTQGFPQQQYQQKHTSLSKLEHANSNAKRRGPMDEMRQLQRILTKLLPGSIIYMPNQDGGGNKVQADDIKVYLAATLGQAPKPDWGLKNGWGQYLADLFNWATGREGDDKITREQAMSCARRPQGRSWEVVFDKLMELGVYSWNWELPLERQQVLNCRKTPPPELTRQQEALAAATAAAAAAAAVTAGATPDAIPSLPVVARMASLLGKRQHQSLPPMHVLPMSAPAAMFPTDSGAGAEAGGSMGAASAGPSAAAAAGDSEAEAGGEERPPKQQRRGSAAATAAGSGGASPVDAPSTSGQAAGQPLAAVSDADLVVPAPEVLAAASVQQLISYIDNSLSGALQALQTRVMSGHAVCPMDYVHNMKNFKLDPLYASFVALIMQAANNQAAMEQQAAQQAALQQAALQVKAEPGGSSQPAAAPVPGPAPVPSTPGPAASTGAAASSAGTDAAGDAAAAAAGAPSDAQGERDTSDAALAAAAAAAGAAAAAAVMAMSQGMSGAAAAPKATGAPPAAKGRKSGKGRAAREPQPSLQHMAMQQSAVQAAALEAAAMAAAARQRQQKAGGGAPSASSAIADRLAQLQAGLAGADGHNDSEDAAQAAAALQALAGSQEQLLPVGMDMTYQHKGNSRLANGGGRGAAAPASPMQAN